MQRFFVLAVFLLMAFMFFSCAAREEEAVLDEQAEPKPDSVVAESPPSDREPLPESSETPIKEDDLNQPSAQSQSPRAEKVSRVEGVRDLTAGSVVYLRVKQYETGPEEKFDPPGEVISLNLGDNVELIKRSETTIPSWLVSNGESQAWVPFFYLTADKNEIAYLKDEGKTPKTLAYYDVNDTGIIAGMFSTSIFVVHSTLGMAASSGGSAQVALEGNGFLISKAGIDHTKSVAYPITMKCEEKVHELHTDTLYLYKDEDSNEEHCFECIDLQTLTSCD